MAGISYLLLAGTAITLAFAWPLLFLHGVWGGVTEGLWLALLGLLLLATKRREPPEPPQVPAPKGKHHRDTEDTPPYPWRGADQYKDHHWI